MRIGIVASEATPFSKTGGLADVSGSLFKVFNKLGNETYLFLPYYKETRSKINDVNKGSKISIKIGGKNIEGRILSKEISKGMNIILIEQNGYFDRENLYGTKEGDYTDNAERFGFFNLAVIESIKLLNLNLDILHLNDWQTGLIPLFLKENDMRIKTLFTIHNLAYQGNFQKGILELLQIDEKYFNIDGIEFYNNLSFLKTGIVYSDFISTVSPTYAKEILTEEFGERLDGILKARKDKLVGILNGIDYKIWNPEKDKNIYKNYSIESLDLKKENKFYLGQKLVLDFHQDPPLFGMVSRLATQKGVDILVEALKDLSKKEEIRVVILGTGEKNLEEGLKALEEEYKSKIRVIIGFDEPLSHNIYAASDFFLMPSKYEPCGLGQIISLKYGTIPVVKETGGLKDTIDNFNDYTQCGNGFSFDEHSSEALANTIKRAFKVYNDRTKFNNLRKVAMNCDFSWENSGKKYLELFKKMMR